MSPTRQRRGCFPLDQDEVDEQATAYGLATWHRPSVPAVVRPRQPARPPARAAGAAPDRVGTVTTGRSHARPARRVPAARRHELVALRGTGRVPQVEGMAVDPATARSTPGGGCGHLAHARRPLGQPVLEDKVREYGVPGTYDEACEECAPGADPGFGGAGSGGRRGPGPAPARERRPLPAGLQPGRRHLRRVRPRPVRRLEYAGGFRVGAPPRRWTDPRTATARRC